MRHPYLAPFLFLAALVCFIVAWLLAINHVFHGGNEPAWVAGGLAFLAAGFLVRSLPGTPAP